MATKKIELTKVPQKIVDASIASYLQSNGGSFSFVFSSTKPTDLSICHSETSLYSAGTLGALWAWKSIHTKVELIVSNPDK